MKKILLVLCFACALSTSLVVRAQRTPSDGPQYVSATELARPTDYREWIFLSAGLGMGYTEPAAGAQPAPPRFTNIFVNPSAYKAFLQTGTWPDKTVFALEARASGGDASINKRGRYQTSQTGLEVEVKDIARFPPDGWAFFNFGAGEQARATAAPLPRTFECYECHARHTAVDNTFVQFYPTLLEVARRKGTLKPGF